MKNYSQSVHLCMVLLTCQTQKQQVRLEKFFASFKASDLSKFGEIHIYNAEQVPLSATSKERDESIYQSHYNIICKYFPYCIETKSHLLVMEDDCQFLEKELFKKIEINIIYLNQYYHFWHIFYLGHIPTARGFWRIKNGLVATAQPCEAHCYIMNYEFLNSLLTYIPGVKWRQPFMIEKWTSLPKYVCFSFFPSVAIQNETPRFFKERNFSYLSYLKFRQKVANKYYYLVPVLTFGVSRFIEEKYIQNLHKKYRSSLPWTLYRT